MLALDLCLDETDDGFTATGVCSILICPKSRERTNKLHSNKKCIIYDIYIDECSGGFYKCVHYVSIRRKLSTVSMRMDNSEMSAQSFP